MVELAIGGEVEWLGEPFTLDTIVKVRPIQKIYRFTVQKYSRSYRISLPKEVVETLGIDESTHYIIFYSVKKSLVVILFFPFQDIFEHFEFKIDGDGTNHDGKGFVGDLSGTILYKLKAVGQLTKVYHKVWVSKNSMRRQVRYGITIPQPIADALGINHYTIFMMLYTPDASMLVLQLKNVSVKEVLQDKNVGEFGLKRRMVEKEGQKGSVEENGKPEMVIDL